MVAVLSSRRHSAATAHSSLACYCLCPIDNNNNDNNNLNNHKNTIHNDPSWLLSSQQTRNLGQHSPLCPANAQIIGWNTHHKKHHHYHPCYDCYKSTTTRQRMLLQECQLTPEQQRLVPARAQAYPTYRFSPNTITWKTVTSHLEDAWMMHGAGIVLALSPQALVIRSHCPVPVVALHNINNNNTNSNTNNNRFSIQFLGDIVATDDRAAAAALLQVASWAVDDDTTTTTTTSPNYTRNNDHYDGYEAPQPLFVHRYAADRSLPLTDAELEQLLTTTTKSRRIDFLDFDWTPAQGKVVTHMGSPISWSLPASMAQPSQHCFFNALLERTTSFGRLHLSDPPPLAFCQQLAQRPTRLLDHLDVTLESFEDDASSHSSNTNNTNIEWLVALLQCRRSIASLCIWITTDHDGFYQAAAAAVAAGRCPVRLQCRRIVWRPPTVPAMRGVVQALASPRCTLRECNVFAQAPADWLRDALQQNGSLEHLVFKSSNLPALADPAVWRAIVRHPRLVRVTVDDAIWTTDNNAATTNSCIPHHDSLAAFLAGWLVRKRQLRIVFHQGSGQRSWERALAPAQRFNRFHCGVVDLLQSDHTRGRRLWALAVRHAVHDPARLGLLLHYHHTPLLPSEPVRKKARLCV